MVQELLHIPTGAHVKTAGLSLICNMSQPHCPAQPPKCPPTLKYILIYLIWTKTHLNPHLWLIRDCPSIFIIYEGTRLSSAILHTTALVFLFSTSMHHLTPSRQPCPLLPLVCVLPNTTRTKPRTELWHKPPLTIIQMLCCTRCEKPQVIQCTSAIRCSMSCKSSIQSSEDIQAPFRRSF